MTAADREAGDPPPGLHPGAFGDWLRERTGREAGAVRWARLSGGRSNLSYLLTVPAAGGTASEGGGARYVLRRPPLGHVQATAHDMAREYRVQAALAGTAVPVPRMIGLCDDPAVSSVPCYVMEHVPGRVVREPADARAMDPAARERAAHAMVDTLAALHGVDPAAVGLDGFGRPEGFLARQVDRWRTQLEGSRSREVPGVDRLHETLAASVPPQRAGPAAGSVVHGDYRLDNLVLADDGSVRAVLDWEMATLGDPLADVGLLLAYWDGLGGGTDAAPRAAASTGATGPRLLAVVPGPASGFPTGADLVARYARATGTAVDDLGWYVALGFFKIAVILEGIHYRHSRGETVGVGFEGIGAFVAPLVAAGLDVLVGAGRRDAGEV